MNVRYIEARLPAGGISSSCFCGSDHHGMVESCPPGTPSQPVVAIGVDAMTTPEGCGRPNRFQLSIEPEDMVRVPLCQVCARTWSSS
jgi:hypothetical protein